MIIKTRKLPATSTEGERMRATAANGATLTVPMDYRLSNPNLDVARKLNRAMGWDEMVVRTADDSNVFHTFTPGS